MTQDTKRLPLIEYIFLLVAAILIPLGVVSICIGIWRRKSKLLMVGIGYLFLSGVLWLRVSFAELWIVNSCLDAGGLYNYHIEACEMEK